MPNNPTLHDDHDTPWKDALTRYFPEFMAFYFPQAANRIDWAHGYTFLDQELAQVVRDAELGKRLVDKLVRVTTPGGAEQWVYIHVEVQGRHDSDFAERLFTYNYRLYDRYRRPVASLAVLADDRPQWKPNQFAYTLFDCEMGIRFPVVKLLDYAPQLDALLEDRNPFALVTATQLLSRQTRQNVQQRFDAKWRLARLLYERDWDRQRIIDLFSVIDWMMQVPPELQKQLWHRIEQLERKRRMPYMTSIERIGLERGIQKGLQKGLEQGMQRGEATVLLRQLAKRFGPLSEALRTRVNEATLEELEGWSERILDARSLQEVFDASEAP